MRKLWLLVPVTILVVGVCALSQRPVNREPLDIRASEVARKGYSGELFGRRVRVVLPAEFPLVLSADGMTGDYCPSHPVKIPQLIRFHFRSPVRTPPTVLLGTVATFEIDIRKRINRLPGYAVITDCVPE